MARHHLDKATLDSPESPMGFWPNPVKEMFFRLQTPPPWSIPKKRKARGEVSRLRFYDLFDEEYIWEDSGEETTTTSNRYELLGDTPTSPPDIEDLPTSKKKNKFPEFSNLKKNDPPDFSLRFDFKDYLPCTTQESVKNNKNVKFNLQSNNYNGNNDFITQDSVLNNSFNDFMINKDKLQDSNSHYMYLNKNNLCTGYMPSFISHDSNEGYEFSKGNNNSHYYLYTKNGKYLKPLSDNVGKYNNVYFDKMRHAYKISKKHRNSILEYTEKCIPLNPNSNAKSSPKYEMFHNSKHNANINQNAPESKRGSTGHDRITNINIHNNNKINSNTLKMKVINNNGRYYRHSIVNPGCTKRRTPGGLGLKDTKRSTPNKCSLGKSKRGFIRGSGGKHTHEHTHKQTPTHTHRQTDTPIHMHIHTHTSRHTQTNTQTHRQTVTHTLPHPPPLDPGCSSQSQDRDAQGNPHREHIQYSSPHCSNGDSIKHDHPDQSLDRDPNHNPHREYIQYSNPHCSNGDPIKPDHPDQSLDRDPNHNHSREYIQYSQTHTQHETLTNQFHGYHCGHPCDHSCIGSHCYPIPQGVGGDHMDGHRCKPVTHKQYLTKSKSGVKNQYLNDTNEIEDYILQPSDIQLNRESYTPRREDRPRPRVNLFQDIEEEALGTVVVPLNTDLEVLLINSRMIDAVKVQTIVENFMIDNNYTTIFCLTETKVEGHDFQPEGIKIISKQRSRKTETFGGGLALGYREDANVELEEIGVKSSDILAVDGRVNNTKFRIVLCYFGSKKLVKGTDYQKNRNLQKQVEKLMEVDPGVSLLVLGDFNGRLAQLEEGKPTDSNGEMLETWVEHHNMHHLNTLDTCDGTYTFSTVNGKSAIDHMLTNDILFDKHISMVIDEDKAMLNISDHNLVRAWFQTGNDNYHIPRKKPVKTITWISREQVKIDKCVIDFKSKIGKKVSFKSCMGKIKTSVEHAMRRKMKRRSGGKKKLTLKAAPWVDEELIVNIKLRSRYSREWRFSRKRGDPEEIVERYKRSYIDQKSKTAIMTQDKKSQWEIKKIEETWKDSKTFWRMIAELLGKGKDGNVEAFIFTEEGEREEIMECRRNFIEAWTSKVYQKLRKADFSFWSDKVSGVKKKMEELMAEGNHEIMECPPITMKELEDTINNMKNNKASGVDNIPAEVMKALMKDREAKYYVLKCFNKALTEEVHQDWLVSRTTMIPKNSRPKILEHRPIAVTVNSNKVICSILRQRIEEFLKEKGIKYNNQFGFTEGGRVEHCMFILDYITNMSYEKRGKVNKPLYLAFIDFKKAYDSIDRRKLIEVLVDYKVNPQIIDIIVQMYNEDYTVIQLGNMKEKVKVTGGIRQGCCISTLLFKMVTFKIIEALRKEKKYKIGKFNDNSIWLADDATLVADSLETMEALLNCLSTAGGEYGLEINEKKTKIMQMKGKEGKEHIKEYEMVKETKYLGVTIGGRYRNIFEIENKNLIGKAKKKVNQIIAEVRKSADKVAVGRAIWKLMALPAILFGRAVVPTCDSKVKAVQRQENRVWRYLMDIGGYSTVAALRGEMGASMVKSRVMETSLQYVRSTMSGDFEDVKELMLDTIKTKKGRWYKLTNSYREELKMTWEEVYEIPKEVLKKKIREYDTLLWKLDLTNKTTLKYYAMGKTEIGYNHCYRNNMNSTFLARARVNSLKLEEAVGRGNIYHDRMCKLCGQEEEDIVHFIVKCKALETKRNHGLLDRSIENPGERMVKFLFKQKDFQGAGRMVKELWFERKDILKNRERLKLKRQHKTVHNIQSSSDPGPQRQKAPLRERPRGSSATRG